MARGIINTFVERLALLGINTTLTGNYPWVYIDTINEQRVTEKFQANHGFTAFMSMGTTSHFTDRREVFKLIRKYTS